MSQEVFEVAVLVLLGGAGVLVAVAWLFDQWLGYQEVKEDRYWQRVANEMEVDRLLVKHKMVRSRR